MKSKKWLCVENWGMSFTKGVVYQSDGDRVRCEKGTFPIRPDDRRASNIFGGCFKEVTFKLYLDELERHISS